MRKQLRIRLGILLTLIALLAIALPVSAQNGAKCDLKTESDYVDRGNTKQSSGDDQGAIDDYNCALELNASNTDALFGRAYSYANIGEDDRAERDYTRLLELDPNNGSAYNNRGNIYYSRGDNDKAIADYSRAIELDDTTDRYIPYSNRGSVYNDEGKYDLALKDLDNAIEINPQYQSAYLTRAFVNQQLGNDDKSRADILNWVKYGETKRIDLDLATFTSGDTLDISEGWVYHLPFDAKVGTILRAAAKTTGEKLVDPLIVLLDADGAPVAWNDDSNNTFDSLLKYKFDTAGSYELLITHAGGGSEGQFKLLFELVTKGT